MPRVALDTTRMQVDDKLVNLAPGMAVTVEMSPKDTEYLIRAGWTMLAEWKSDQAT